MNILERSKQAAKNGHTWNYEDHTELEILLANLTSLGKGLNRMKRCSKCGQVKLLSEFRIERLTYRSECRQCEARARTYRKTKQANLNNKSERR